MNNKNSDLDQPLDRAFRILELIAAAESPLSVTDIAASLKLPAPTVHRLVGQLLERHLLKREFSQKTVLVGPRLVHISAGALKAAVVTDKPKLVLERLAHQLDEHCQIGIVTDGQVHYVDTVQANRTFGLQFQPGRKAPLYCTSIGKLYLASLPDTAFHHWLKSAQLAPFTAKTKSDRDALAKEVTQVRKRGWSVTKEEFVEGIVGCAVPIMTRDRFVAGLGVAAPTVRLGPKRLKEILPLLRDAANEITEALAAAH